MYLCGADTDWLLKDDPGDTLQQGRCGQRAIIGPIIQRSRKESLWVKVIKGGLFSLEQPNRGKMEGKQLFLIVNHDDGVVSFLSFLSREKKAPLMKAEFMCQVLTNIYRGAMESMLTGNMTNWHEHQWCPSTEHQ